jgi:hypothetical protein
VCLWPRGLRRHAGERAGELEHPPFRAGPGAALPLRLRQGRSRLCVALRHAVAGAHRPRKSILPRSRHRPVASTEGRATEKINKTRVRLWTACSETTATRFDVRT